MSRLADAILQGAYSTGKSSPMLDLQFGGQNGYAPNLTEWVSQTHYVRKNIHCILLEAPVGFRYLPDSAFWIRALKNMVEVHARTIEGLNAGLDVQYSETAVSGGGEMFEDAINVTRERSNVTFGFTDLYGRPMQNFIHNWITYLIGDADNKVPMINTLTTVRPFDMLADISSATMLFMEPDPTHSKVSKAWLGTNMKPRATGTIDGRKDLTAGGELSELSIGFTGVYQSGVGVDMFAQAILNSLNLNNANPNLRPAFARGINAEVYNQGRGLAGNMNDLANTAIRT
jgi:hypothetical protein